MVICLKGEIFPQSQLYTKCGLWKITGKCFYSDINYRDWTSVRNYFLLEMSLMVNKKEVAKFRLQASSSLTSFEVKAFPEINIFWIEHTCPTHGPWVTCSPGKPIMQNHMINIHFDIFDIQYQYDILQFLEILFMS